MEVELNDVRVVHVRRDRVQHRGPRVVIRARVEVDRDDVGLGGVGCRPAGS